MKSVINNIFTFLIAAVGLIGGCFWAYSSNWEMEPTILVIISALEIVGFLIVRLFVIPEAETDTKYQQNIANKKKVVKQINIQENKGKIDM